MEENAMEEYTTNELVLNNQSKKFLRETAKWAYFFSIIMFISIGFIILIALFAGTIFSAIPNDTPGLEGIGGAFITVVYFLMAALYFFPALYLYKFSVKMKRSLRRNDSNELTIALENLKSHYKIIGIFTIVMLVFYAIMILFGLMAAVASF